MKEKIHPTTGFTLELNGISPALLTQKELEAYSGANLNSESGANISFGYDLAEDALVLKKLSHPLDSQDAISFVLQRTNDPRDGLQYIAFIEAAGGVFRPSSADESHSMITNDMVQSILAGYGITDTPHPTHDSYQLWRANLLSDCQEGWKITEEAEIFMDLDEHKTESILIRHNETYNENGEATRTKKVARQFTLHGDDESSVQHMQAIITQISTPYGQSLNLRNETCDFTTETFVSGETGTVSNQQWENIPLDKDSFAEFSNLLEETSLSLRRN